MVEVQTGIKGANGSSPGGGNFIKNVFSFVFKFGLILSNIIEIKHIKYNIFLVYEKFFFPSAPLGNRTAALL